MENLKSKYITADDFKMYFGIDLESELKSDDNPSNTANAFLYRIETRLSAYINATFYRNVDLEYGEFTDYQKEHYKLALLEQAYYVLRNGDISSDSGYDPEHGVIAPNGELNNIMLSTNCKQQLMLCGLWCRKIKSNRGGIDGWLY